MYLNFYREILLFANFEKYSKKNFLRPNVNFDDVLHFALNKKYVKKSKQKDQLDCGKKIKI
jgi:hypothetical protein